MDRTRLALDRGIVAGQHLGAQVYVSVAGEVAADFAVGEMTPGTPMETRSLAIWLCCTKPVTAVAIARLVEQGLLKPDTSVHDILPEFTGDGRDGILLRHLLTHTSGLRDDPKGGVIAAFEPHERVLAGLFSSPLAAPPGTTAAYSVWKAWYLLGEVLARMTGETLAEYARREIFTPLGMGDSWIGMPAAAYDENAGRIAPLYLTGGGTLTAVPLIDSRAAVTRTLPGGGGRGPMRELGRFLETLLPSRRTGDERVLSSESVAALRSVHRHGMFDEMLRSCLDWGLGLAVDRRAFAACCSPRTWGHTGLESVIGFADADHDLACAIFLNGIEPELAAVMRRNKIVTAVYRDLGILASGRSPRSGPTGTDLRHGGPRATPERATSEPLLPWPFEESSVRRHLLARGGAQVALDECLFSLAQDGPVFDRPNCVIAFELTWLETSLSYTVSMLDGHPTVSAASAGTPDLVVRWPVIEFFLLVMEVSKEFASPVRYARGEVTGDPSVLPAVDDLLRAMSARSRVVRELLAPPAEEDFPIRSTGT